MLCSRCDSRSPTALAHRRAAAPVEGASGVRSDRLVCRGCGATLPRVDLWRVLIDKLSELARFGLSAGEPPLMRQRFGRPVDDRTDSQR